MKMQNLALAIALASPAASYAELQLHTNGVGDAIYLPYYTVEDGRTTLLTLENQSDKPSAVSVSFNETLNGRPVLIFNVYLAAGDSYTVPIVSLSSMDNAPEPILPSAAIGWPHNDLTCTVPDTSQLVSQEFFNYAYSGNSVDGGPSDLARTRTGAIEIIEMGEVGDEDLAKAIADHDCVALSQAWKEGIWAENPNSSMLPPKGKLHATADIINVEEGYSFTPPSYAISGFSGLSPFNIPRHILPSDPNHYRITDPVPNPSDPAPGTQGYTVRLDSGEVIEYPDGHGADAISALFMARALTNRYSLNEGLGTSTEWIVSFPTKHAYVDDQPGGLLPPDTAPRPPFHAAFDNGKACEGGMVLVVRDRDGKAVTQHGENLGICGQVNRLRLATTPDPAVMYAPGTIFVGDTETGMASLSSVYFTIETPGPRFFPDSTLPMVAFSVSIFSNANAQPGRLATYATMSPHVATAPPVWVISF